MSANDWISDFSAKGSSDVDTNIIIDTSCCEWVRSVPCVFFCFFVLESPYVMQVCFCDQMVECIYISIVVVFSSDNVFVVVNNRAIFCIAFLGLVKNCILAVLLCE